MLRTLAVVLALALVGATLAQANPAGMVATAGFPGMGEAVHLDADYEYEYDSAVIAREQVGPGADPLAPLPVHRELAFRQRRHLVTPKVEVAIYHGVWLSFAVPIVLGQSREVAVPDGVDRGSATTFTEGILPTRGFDARDPAMPPANDVVFRGVARTGVPELRGGLGFAPMIQAVDATKPTWKLGIEMRFAIGRAMRFSAVEPARESGVSTAVHELRLWTSVDRRYRYFEGWFDAYYQLPVYTRTSALYKDPGSGASNVEPAHTAGASFGVEGYLVNNTETGNRLGVELGARVAAHFEGRGYSELWEVFAFAGRPGGPLALDRDPVAAGAQDLAHPGVSNIENYLETAGRLALRGKLGAHATFAAFGELVWKTDHAISFADAGIDLPTCPSGAPRCEPDDNDLVNPGTQEVNPLHARAIDLVGHRYRSERNRGVVLGAQLQLLF